MTSLPHNLVSCCSNRISLIPCYNYDNLLGNVHYGDILHPFAKAWLMVIKLLYFL